MLRWSGVIWNRRGLIFVTRVCGARGPPPRANGERPPPPNPPLRSPMGIDLLLGPPCPMTGQGGRTETPSGVVVVGAARAVLGLPHRRARLGRRVPARVEPHRSERGSA